jgi:hypothetical protein
MYILAMKKTDQFDHLHFLIFPSFFPNFFIKCTCKHLKPDYVFEKKTDLGFKVPVRSPLYITVHLVCRSNKKQRSIEQFW